METSEGAAGLQTECLVFFHLYLRYCNICFHVFHSVMTPMFATGFIIQTCPINFPPDSSRRLLPVFTSHLFLTPLLAQVSLSFQIKLMSL